MTIKVVDTNVAVAANGRHTHADESCQLSCIEAIEDLVANCKVAIDSIGRILDEYSGCLNHSGSPGVGDKFFKYIVNNQYLADKCLRVEIHVTPDGSSYDEFPTNPLLVGFDQDDHKFVAVALVLGGGVPILNATDSDWANFSTALASEGVVVDQLCPQHANRGE